MYFWEKPIYKFPGEYCLNVSKQLEYKSSACIFFKYFLCIMFYVESMPVMPLSSLLSSEYREAMLSSHWSEPNDLTVLAYQEEIIMLSYDNKP
jgi:hypothetical protein